MGPEGAVYRHVLHKPKLLITSTSPSQASTPSMPICCATDPAPSRRGFHHHLLHPQYGIGGGNLRPHHSHQQIAQYTLGAVSTTCGVSKYRGGTGHYSLTYTDADPTRCLWKSSPPLAGTFCHPVDTRGRNVLSTLRLAPGATSPRSYCPRQRGAHRRSTASTRLPGMNDIFIRPKANDPNTLL